MKLIRSDEADQFLFQKQSATAVCNVFFFMEDSKIIMLILIYFSIEATLCMSLKDNGGLYRGDPRTLFV